MSKQPGGSVLKPKVSKQPANNDLRATLWLGLALLFLYLLTAPAHKPYGDEEGYLVVAHNILTQGSPALIRTQPEAGGQFHGVVTYSKFFLGQSLLMLPFAAVELMARQSLPVGLSFVPQMIISAFPALQSAAVCCLLFLLIRMLA